jgi:hypothetical protein
MKKLNLLLLFATAILANTNALAQSTNQNNKLQRLEKTADSLYEKIMIAPNKYLSILANYGFSQANYADVVGVGYRTSGSIDHQTTDSTRVDTTYTTDGVGEYALGFRYGLGEHFSVEATATYSHFELTGWRVQPNAAQANYIPVLATPFRFTQLGLNTAVIYQFNPWYRANMRFYVGAGLRYNSNTFNQYTIKDTTTLGKPIQINYAAPYKKQALLPNVFMGLNVPVTPVLNVEGRVGYAKNLYANIGLTFIVSPPSIAARKVEWAQRKNYRKAQNKYENLDRTLHPEKYVVKEAPSR